MNEPRDYRPETACPAPMAQGQGMVGRALNPNVDRRPVVDHLANLESLVGGLETELEIHVGRLECVLQPAGPYPTGPPNEQPEVSTVAHRLLIVSEQIQKFTTVIHQATARLEI